jgi:rod shape-determining protein MreC
MRTTWRANRIVFFLFCTLLCAGLITVSAAGAIGPVEGILAGPVSFLTGLFNDVALSSSALAAELAEIQTLRERNAELEAALAQFQAELVELREIASDYTRLTELAEYSSTREDLELLTADVIYYDPSSRIRTIVINVGTRDGIAAGMPVVSAGSLVGRVIQVSANAARVLLVTDESSYVSSRLQTSREEGSVVGLLTGNLRMIDIPLDAEVQEGDLVITSGLGGNFPTDLVIGQVSSVRQFEFELSQEAEVRSLVSFGTLEFVQVITSFQPIDISVFESQDDQP